MPQVIDRDEVQRLLQDGAQLVEVLPNEEYDREHIRDAVNIPLEDFSSESLSQLNPDKPVIVYCWDYQCDLSPRAAWRLETLGFTDVYDYAASKADWLASGGPSEGEGSSKKRIGDFARKPPTCRLDETIAQVKGRVETSGMDRAIVVNEGDVVLGSVEREALDGDRTSKVADVLDEGPTSYRADVSLSEIEDKMKNADMSSVIVSTSRGELIGLFERQQVIDVTQKEDRATTS